MIDWSGSSTCWRDESSLSVGSPLRDERWQHPSRDEKKENLSRGRQRCYSRPYAAPQQHQRGEGLLVVNELEYDVCRNLT